MRYQKLKTEIAALAKEQPTLKYQRKTTITAKERTLEPWKAVATHLQNRFKLRYMYAALALLRGRDLSTVEVALTIDERKEMSECNYMKGLLSEYAEPEPVHSIAE